MGANFLKELLQLKPQQPKPQRNICFGNAKSSGVGASGGQDTMLAADVNLVASGVGKGCSPELLRDFLVGKGITPVEVVMLTKNEVLDQVRTLTFRIAVKAADYEAALKPEVWPYRVGVRHYKAPRRERPENSWQGQADRTGGYVDQGGAVGAQAHGGAYEGARSKQFLPPGHPDLGSKNQQLMGQQQPGIEISNILAALCEKAGITIQ